MEPERLNREQAARLALLELAVVEYYANAGVIAPSSGYEAEHLADLRMVRRLMSELELDHPAIEVILRMRRRMIGMQREMAQLQAALRRTQRTRPTIRWVEAEWDDLGDAW